MEKNKLVCVLYFAFLVVIACGSDVAARTNQVTITLVVTPTAAPVATATSEPISTAIQVVSTACLQAILTALQGHQHNLKGEIRFGNMRAGPPTYFEYDYSINPTFWHE